MKVADYVVSFLSAMGVRHIFGYPGSPLVPLLAAIDRHPDVRWVLMRHENSAALAASADGKLTGRLSVCVATSGPGALNFVCGVADAHLDRVPMLALTGLVPTASQGHWEFQDVDQTRLFAAILDRSATCIHPQQLTALIRNFVGHAQQQHQTVHLALPSDILDMDIEGDSDLYDLAPEQLPMALRLMPPPAEALDVVAKELERYRQVAIVVGRRSIGCGAALETLAEKLQAPIITSLDGKGIVDESHPNSLGVLGIFGFPGVERAKQILRRSDAVLAFGTDTLKPFLTDHLDVQRRALIQCEPEFAWLTHEYHRARTLVGPLESIAHGLWERVREREHSSVINGSVAERRRDCEQAVMADTVPGPRRRHADPAAFLRTVNRHLDEHTTVVLDTGAHTLWTAQFLRLTHRQRVLVSSRLGTMGFSLPAAIAAQLADPDHKVLVVCGDGGFQMVVGELATAVQYRLPIVVIVFNNGVLQNVAAQQAVPYGTDLYNPDFVALARSYGASGAMVEGGTDVEAVIRKAFERRDVPFVIDLRCESNMMAPLSKWDTTVESATIGD